MLAVPSPSPSELRRREPEASAEWMATVRTYSEVDVAAAVDDDERRVRLAPAEVVLPEPSTMAAPRPAALVGTLRAVDLDERRFRIEDDAGHRIALTVPTELRDASRPADWQQGRSVRRHVVHRRAG